MTVRRGRHGLKNDPERRQRIIDATARIIGSRGMNAVTFRSVATEAGVPLGSTTYHFVDKDDLLRSTVQSLKERSNEHIGAVLRRAIPSLGVARGVAATVEEITTDWRDEFFQGYGVYISTFSQRNLRDEVVDWTLVELFEEFMSPAAATALGYFVEGVLTHVILGNVRVTADELEPAITALLALE